ncbi:4'-phosphopantetheinyl transferase superfamily protein [Streptomyces sp. NPDC006798]|uniref:4'-phosphopantetheinyl transferase family protein n=1 Tax=Streptomyces sp. NPDC006798 TaxID=3155462 RepID=UPI0033F5E384
MSTATGLRRPARYAAGVARLVDLHDPPRDAPGGPAALAVLSAAERHRAGAFRDPAAALTYIRSRAAVRRLLAEALGGPAARVELVAGPGGRPLLPAHPGWSVSWSRSAGLLLVAVRYGGPVGVDVEVVRPVRRAARVLGTFYPKAPELGELDEPEAFFSAWTLLEAAVKASGRGLARGARDVRLVRRPGARRCALGGIRGTDSPLWSGRTDRFAVAPRPGPGRHARARTAMTAVVTSGPLPPPLPEVTP